MTRDTKSCRDNKIQDTLDKNQATLAASGRWSEMATFAGRDQSAKNLPAVLALLRLNSSRAVVPRRRVRSRTPARAGQQTRGATYRSADAGHVEGPPHGRPVRQRRRALPSRRSTRRSQQDKALELDQIKKLYSDFLGSGAGEVSIVGDFDPAACLPILQQTFFRLDRPRSLRVFRSRYSLECEAASTKSSRRTRPTQSILPGSCFR